VGKCHASGHVKSTARTAYAQKTSR
jgi:hypothetical protein